MTDAVPAATSGPDGGAADWLQRSRLVSWIRRPRELGTAPTWFEGGSLNTCFNALDRHVVRGQGDSLALVVPSRTAQDDATYTFAELLERVAALAGALRGFGVAPGDAVLAHLPTGAEAVVAMLACARVGAVHAVLPAEADAATLAAAVDDLRPPVVVTTASGSPGDGRPGPYEVVDRALALCRHHPQAVVVHRRGTDGSTAPLLDEPRDVDWDAVLRAGATDPAGSLELAAADPLSVRLGPGGSRTVRRNGAHAVVASWVASRVVDGGPGSVWWATDGVVADDLLTLDAPLLGGLTTVLHEPVDAEDAWRTVRDRGVDVVLTTAATVESWRRGAAGRVGDRPLRSLVVLDGALEPDTLQWAGERLSDRVLTGTADGAVGDDPLLATYGLPALATAAEG